MELGAHIKEHRKELGLSQDDLAAKIYVSRQTISNWEVGHAAVMPLPSELTTPPVTNICFVMVFTCASRRNLHRSPALPRDFSVPPAYHDDGEHGKFMNLKRKAV